MNFQCFHLVFLAKRAAFQLVSPSLWSWLLLLFLTLLLLSTLLVVNVVSYV